MDKLYVALGDSMSIDDYAGGAGRGAASLLHRNRDADFPDWADRDLTAAGYAVRVLARDGALTADVIERQLPSVQGPVDLVTVTMGGNDLLSVYGDDSAAAAVVGRVEAQAEGVLVRLRRIVGRDCRIVVTTVYDPSDGTGAVPGSGLASWGRGPHWIRTLNAVLISAAGRHGAVVADVHAAFHGHGVTAGDPARSDARPADRDLWFCGVVEPNAWGAHHIRATWWEALTALT
ncbi:SGNH/GDSL hydrolase family protein [Actinoplanes utahensis]|uniref:SGNH/GDSL hydrolase family protein n=1 Tax=Actinoplanes utahensis TaxID=1869 RepID=UPI0019519D21|nr:SGNH/GDSL hydrolase family protein [Actinoplanes utahensis]GIF33906.1 hypothetical protein Aut01nite_68920 [Actinoplanes utahensis]